MVFFSCNACGSSVKKNQVEKHYQFQCRSCSVLSCMDCGQDFHGDTYKNHVKCITEDEKYGHKDFIPKQNKGEMKQKAWVSQVQEAMMEGIRKAPRPVAEILKTLESYDNIPRKQKKFENFLQNCLAIRDMKLAHQVWVIFDNVQKSGKPTEQNGEAKSSPASMNPTPSETVVAPTTGTKRIKHPSDDNHKTKKSKNNNLTEETVNDISQGQVDDSKLNENGIADNFHWSTAMISVLTETTEHELSMKKFKKKVFKKYNSSSSKSRSEEKLSSMLDKKLTKHSDRIHIDGSTVKLINLQQ